MVHEISYQLDRSVPAARGCPQTASFVLGKHPTFQNEVFVSESTASPPPILSLWVRTCFLWSCGCNQREPREFSRIASLTITFCLLHIVLEKVRHFHLGTQLETRSIAYRQNKHVS